MQRDVLLRTEMIDAAEQIQQLTAGVTVSRLEADRQAMTPCGGISPCCGEATGQLSAEVKDRIPE